MPGPPSHSAKRAAATSQKHCLKSYMTPEDLIEAVEDLVGSTFLITKGLESDLVLNF